MTNVGTSSPTIARWKGSRGSRIAAKALYPLVWALNRPSMAWVGRAAYDVALRLNGIAITWKGKHGLTSAEEKLLRRLGPGFGRDVVMDVGANSGDYAIFVMKATPLARVLAFEPHPRTFRVMCDKMAGKGIEPFNLALGEVEGTVQLHDFATANGSTQASLSADAVSLYGEGVVSHDVECTTIDAFVAAKRIERIAYLKVDTEGHDLAVLRGARRALREKRIGMVQFEFIPANIATGVRMRDFFEVLEGYRIHRLCLNGALLPLDYSVRHTEIFETQNLVAVAEGARP